MGRLGCFETYMRKKNAPKDGSSICYGICIILLHRFLPPCRTDLSGSVPSTPLLLTVRAHTVS